MNKKQQKSLQPGVKGESGQTWGAWELNADSEFRLRGPAETSRCFFDTQEVVLIWELWCDPLSTFCVIIAGQQIYIVASLRKP